MVPHFYHTSRQDPGALFELRRWAAIPLPTFQFDNTSAPGPSTCADTVSVSLTIADKLCDEWKPAYIQSLGSFKDYKPRNRKITYLTNTAHGSRVYWKIKFPWNSTMTGLSIDVWSIVFVHSVEQLAGMCRFLFLRSGWRFDRWAVILCSLSANQGAQRDAEIIPNEANKRCFMNIRNVLPPLCILYKAL